MALLVTVALPDTIAADVGVKVTLSNAVCPAPMDCPTETAVAVNPVPVIVKFETVTGELPLFVSVTF